MPVLLTAYKTRAFTLPEVLVSILIFMIISGAMFGIFLSVTQLYREGEFARSANDRSQIVTNLLERDLLRAVPGKAGGVFYAWLDEHSSDPGHSSGNCVIGWVMRNDNQNFDRQNPFVFVLWGIQHDLETTTDAEREPLRRCVMNINQDLSTFTLASLKYASGPGPDPTIITDDDYSLFDPFNPLPALRDNSQRATTVTDECLLFSVSLTGTAHEINAAFAVCDKPALNEGASTALGKTTYWNFVSNSDITDVNDEPLSEPNTPGAYYSNEQTLTIAGNTYQKTYPNGIRISMILSAEERFQQTGYLQADLGPTDKDYVRFAGIESIASTPGSFIRVGNDYDNFEWIGYHDYDRANGCHINTEWEHGPCMPLSGTLSGRGIFKSTPRDHQAANRVAVRSGRLLTLSRTLPE